jgi:hypothetical protein
VGGVFWGGTEKQGGQWVVSGIGWAPGRGSFIISFSNTCFVFNFQNYIKKQKKSIVQLSPFDNHFLTT